MTPEFYQRLREIYHQAGAVTGQARDELIERLCDGDAALLAEVRVLLEHDEQDADGLADANLSLARQQLSDALATDDRLDNQALPDDIPATIGRYRVLRRLGEGGMGIVFEAEQEHPARRVALKLVRMGLGSRQPLRRFQHEAEMLGRLKHAGIAHIYEAGLHVTPTKAQIPFLAMELIDGIPITEYADRDDLSARDRLALLTRVCDAIEHAHRNGVIHRDLKPGNVLVDASGQPKVLDFGIARATDADLRMTTMHTATGQLLGTLPYMSPEQVGGDSADVDTRTDVYALGVIAFELLSGDLPLTVRGRSIPDAVRMIREEDPSRLSTINSMFRGDVETIVAKALEKDKERRYASAAEFAADIRRFLHDEPIIARPASTIYQLKKFARRNRGLVGGVATALIVLIAGVVVSTFLAITASRERLAAEAQRDRAVDAEQRAQRLLTEAEAARDAEQAQREEAVKQGKIARAVNDFLNNDLLAAVSPEAQGKDVSMQDVLAAASKNITGKFEGEPDVEIAVRKTIANTYRALGKFDQVVEHLERNLELERKLYGADHRDTLISQNNLALTYKNLNRMEDAERLYQQTLEDRRRALGEDHPDVYESMLNLGAHYWEQGRYKEAYPLMARVLARYRERRGSDHPDTLDAINNLSLICVGLGRYDEAVSLTNEALDTRRRVLGGDHPSTLVSVTNAGALMSRLGRFSEACQLRREAHEGFKRKLGDEHPNTIITLGGVGDELRRLGRYEEAEPLLKQALELCTSLAGPDNSYTLAMGYKVLALLVDTKRFEEAEKSGLDAIKRAEAALGAGHDTTIRLLYHMGRLYLDSGRIAKAREIAADAVQRSTTGLGPTHFETLRMKRLLADIHMADHEPVEAERLYAEALAGLRETLPASHPQIGVTLRQHGLLRLSQGKVTEARADLLEAHKILAAALGDEHPRVQATVRGLVDVCERAGYEEEAARWREQLATVVPAPQRK